MLAWSPHHIFSFPDCASLAEVSIGLGVFLVISNSSRPIKFGVEFWLSSKADLKVSCLAFWWRVAAGVCLLGSGLRGRKVVGKHASGI